MPVDYNEGTWTIGAEGVGKDRAVVGVLWCPFEEVKNYSFECNHEITLVRNVKVKGVTIMAETKAIIVELRDPTLSPKHYNFIGVYFVEQEVSTWLFLDDIVDSSQGEESDLTEFGEDSYDEVPPTVH